jgi:SHAQKYF class myb-like DNA-binding protein
LHASPCSFVEAVEQSGGILHATPRAILDILGLEGVTYAQVKSHLQRHRTAHIADMLERGEEVGDVSEAQLRWGPSPSGVLRCGGTVNDGWALGRFATPVHRAWLAGAVGKVVAGAA